MTDGKYVVNLMCDQMEHFQVASCVFQDLRDRRETTVLTGKQEW